MFKSQISPLEKSLWSTLSSQAGLSTDDYERQERWAHSGTRKHSMVALYRRKDGHGVVLKASLQDITSDQFEDLVETQHCAAVLLDGKDFGVPRVVAADPKRKALLMEEVRGDQLFDLIESEEHHEPYLERAGAWIAAFHRSGLEGDRAFKPDFNIRRISKIQDDVQKGREAVCESKEFQKSAGAVLKFLPSCTGTTQAAWQHGDMNLHNFILSGDRIFGIDFTKVDTVPIGYDVARFLLHYGALLADHRKLMPGYPVDPSCVAAFFRGYDLVKYEDPSIQAILRVRILNDWLRYPDSYSKMKMRQRFRFERYRTLLGSLLQAG